MIISFEQLYLVILIISFCKSFLSLRTMAFAGKLGSLLKKTTSVNSSLFQTIRCMSSSKLFVGGSALFEISLLICLKDLCFLLLLFTSYVSNIFSGLSYSTDEQDFREEFGNYGTVVEGILPPPFICCTHIGYLPFS